MTDFLKDGYYARRILGVDTETGLNREIRATQLLINAKVKEIHIEWDLCLCTEGGHVMHVERSGRFKRFNTSLETKYDNLRASAIGQGIKQMIEALDFANVQTDLSNFPECFDQNLPPQ